MHEELGAGPMSFPMSGLGEVDVYRLESASGMLFDVAVVLCGEGNVVAAGAVATALTVLRPDLVGLSGIAGGLKDVEVGDVALATKIVYTEPGRAEARFKPRGDRERASREMRDLLHRVGTVDGIRTVAGTIASQEKVLVDLRATDYRRIRDYASDAIAVDTESWGLAGTAKDHRVEWVVSRGISDKIKGKGDEDPQEQAARRAARVLLNITETWLDRFMAVAPRTGGVGLPVTRQVTLPPGWQPSPDVERISDALEEARAIVVLAPRGAGKSTLARALRLGRQRVLGQQVAALAEFAPTDDVESIARRLSDELVAQIPMFAQIRRAFELRRTFEEVDAMAPWMRLVVGPLAEMRGDVPSVLFLLDGLERLPPAAFESVLEMMSTLQSGLGGAHARTVAFARHALTDQLEGAAITLDPPTAEALSAYAAVRISDPSARAELIARDPASWLEADQAAAALNRGEMLAPRSESVSERTRSVWRDRVTQIAHRSPATGSILAILAPIPRVTELPEDLVGAALLSLTGQLVPLEPLVAEVSDLVVSEQRDSGRRFRLVHDLLAEIIDEDLAELLNVDAARDALVEANRQALGSDIGFGLSQLIAEVEAEGLLRQGEPVAAASRIRRSLFGAATDNVMRLEWWIKRLGQSELAAASEAVLHLRVAVAHEELELQAPGQAVETAESVVAEARDSREARMQLLARTLLATAVGRFGDNRRASGELRAVIADMKTTPDLDPWDLMQAELELAYTEALAEANPERATELAAIAKERFADLAARADALWGPGDEHTLNARHNEAFFTGRSGFPEGAVSLYEDLLPDSVAFRGALYKETLTIRHEIAFWTSESGDLKKALEDFEALLPTRLSVFGETHPRTLLNRLHIVRIRGELGHSDAVMQAGELVRDCLFALGKDHEVTARALALLSQLTGS
ncbi:MAG TPA: hypothetical protein VG448_02185 [Solirubrobacterales bacterium]|nr:hypothetical protein [Solirubrobacterales bacterium]